MSTSWLDDQESQVTVGVVGNSLAKVQAASKITFVNAVMMMIILLCVLPLSFALDGSPNIFDLEYQESQFDKLRKSNPYFERIYQNQYPSNCRSRQGWVLENFQETGLGTIISFQLAALLHRALERNAVLIVDTNTLSSKYFTACDDVSIKGKFECLFQPLSSCTRHSVGHVGMFFPNTKNVNRNINLPWNEWVLLSAFISRPSKYALEMAKSASSSMVVNGHSYVGQGTAVHIRQGQPAKGQDWARELKHIWTDNEILNIVKRIAEVRRKFDFVVISDDPTLVRGIRDHSNVVGNYNNISVFITTDAVKHVNSTSDCVRERVLGCDQSVGEVAVAKSVIVDLVMASRTNLVLASMESTYAWLLMGMASAYNGALLLPSSLMDLDNPNCIQVAVKDDSNSNCNFRHHERGPFNHPTPPVTAPTAAPVVPLPFNQLAADAIIGTDSPPTPTAISVTSPVSPNSEPTNAPHVLVIEDESKSLLDLPHPTLDLSTSTQIFADTTNCPFCKLVNENIFLQKIWLNQFPENCGDKRAVVIEDFQVTGLGTVIGFQLAALLSLATKHRLVFIIADKVLSPPYFKACEEGHPLHGKFECLFQKVTSCTEQSVGRIAHRFSSTKTANDNVHHTWQEWVLLDAFLSRPSEYAIQLTNQVLPGIQNGNILSGHGTTAHIRQGTRKGPDLVTKHKTIWSPHQLMTLFSAVSTKTNNREYVVISDSPQLTNDLASNNNPANTHMNIIVTSQSVEHVNSFNDCVREPFLGCDASVGEVKVSKSVVIDMVLASRNEKLIASVDSTFAWLLMGMMSVHRGTLLQPSDIFDLDNPNCRINDLEGSVRSGGCGFRHHTRGAFTHPTSK